MFIHIENVNKNITFGIFLLSLVFLVGYASAADVNVTPIKKTVIQGQTFDLNISIDPRGTAIAGAQLKIGFNKSVIKINNIIEGNLFKQNGANTFFNPGTINNSLGTVVSIYDMILGPYSVSTPGAFIIINATAVDISGTSGINLSNVLVGEPNGQAIALNVINGTVNINGTELDITLPVMRFINGTVMDSVTKAGIPGVRVFTNSSITTLTNETGFYSFAVVSGTYNITATFEPTYYVNSTTVSTALSAVVVHNIELLKKPTGTIAGGVRNAKL